MNYAPQIIKELNRKDWENTTGTITIEEDDFTIEAEYSIACNSDINPSAGVKKITSVEYHDEYGVFNRASRQELESLIIEL